ncbi:hypothetical protein [Paracoccus sp. IB05]|uniref:hypothetical protein n=1 Tax=Paracoccus sp. IB05 TaxID=2779367 RepID=UPI0018E834E9|nr:hypothetical protein [Paracoccus sp. IB05]MBJ2149629.1 hypothetical protein [Paracoccus sp. IB05]
MSPNNTATMSPGLAAPLFDLAFLFRTTAPLNVETEALPPDTAWRATAESAAASTSAAMVALTILS